MASSNTHYSVIGEQRDDGGGEGHDEHAEQQQHGGQGSANVHVMSHVPLGRVFTVGDIEVEQELSRPYSYVPRLDGTNHSAGMNIISLKDPHNAKSIWNWNRSRGIPSRSTMLRNSS